MRRGTTPDITFTIPFAASTITKLSVVFAQRDTIVVEKDLEDVVLSGYTITTNLTEAETLKFEASIPVDMQIRCGVGDERLASNIMTTSMEMIIKGGIL